MVQSASPQPAIVSLPDEVATSDLGNDLAAVLGVGHFVALRGDIGAGKTTLARSIIRSFLDSPDLAVPSPTFTLVESYESVLLTIAHADLHRLEDTRDVEQLALLEVLDTGILLVEWPEQAGNRLPTPDLTITLDASDVTRTARLETADPQIATRLIRTLRMRRFMQDAGWHRAWRRPLNGDASHRSYEHVERDDGTPRKAILMNSPPDSPGPVIRNGKTYADIAHIALDMSAFVAIDRVLLAKGFAAPQLFAEDLNEGLLLEEILGYDGIVADGAPIPERYIAAAEGLADLHMCTWPSDIDMGGGHHHRIPAFDLGVVDIEVSLALDWYLPFVVGRIASAEAVAEFRGIWVELGALVAADQTTLVLRDYHSPNIIWRGDRDGTERLGLIDFQDALIGPPAYDLASVAQDARVTVPPELEADMVDAYVARRMSLDPSFDEDHLGMLYAVMAAQRAFKVLGIFARLNYRDGKPAYLAHIPRIRSYLSRTLEHPSLAQLKGWYRTYMSD